MKDTPKLNVLFIEDDLVDQMALKRMADKNGLIQNPEFADSIHDAAEKLECNEYDVIVTDYHLKDGVGMEIISKSRNKPVIVVTGMGDESLAVEAMKAGAVDYMVKDPHNGHLEILPLAINRAHDQYVKTSKYKEAEERYHDLFENSTDLIQSVGPEGNFLYVNPSWMSSLGYNEKEVRKLNFMGIVHPDYHQHCMEMFQVLMTGKSFQREEIWFISKTGEIVIVEGNISCRIDDFGKPVATRGIFRNVTESRVVENQLKKSEKQYRLLVESANDIIYYSDSTGKLKYVNKHGPTFTGFPEEELLGRHFTSFIDDEHRPEVFSFYMKQFNEKIESTYLEFPITKKDGEKLWVGQSVRMLYDEDDSTNVIGFLGIVRDINATKKLEDELKVSNQVLEKRVSLRTRELEKINSKLRKEIELRTDTETALKKSEEEYRGLFQNAHDAILIYDPKEEKVLEVNNKACQIYGYKREDFIGLPTTEISTRRESDRIALASRIKKGVYTNYESINKSADEKEMILEVNATSLIYKGREAILCINQDVTLKREVEKNLLEERAQRMTALIDGQEMERKRLSRELHDGLGQLLTASLIYLRQLYKAVDSENAEKLIDTTREIIENTIEEVRSISHNLMPAVLNDFGLELALKNMVGSINGKFDGSLQFKSTGEQKRFRQDLEIGLYRIAQEALNNALKYSDGDRIDINLSKKEGLNKLTIKDNGKGFDVTSKVSSQSGNGVYNMNERSKLIGCDFNIISSHNEGTEVVVKFVDN